jgi:hypothetical protein
MTTDDKRWWYCTQCLAINDGLEASRCWNCDHYERMRKSFPWVETRHQKCQVCGKRYMVWILPPNTDLKDEEHALGLCIDYFQHYGDNAYFPPMLPLDLMLRGNGWRYDEKKNRVVKVRTRV